MTRALACGYLAMALALLGCSGDGSDARDGLTEEPPPGVKLVFDWGYPEYSEYMNGKHVGTTLYQRDATCKRRLTFYACAFINAETPNNAMNNPTMASQAMMAGLGSGLDSCTVEIENTEPRATASPPTSAVRPCRRGPRDRPVPIISPGNSSSPSTGRPTQSSRVTPTPRRSWRDQPRRRRPR